MKIFVGLCVLALVSNALADCGCLKCNPQLQVVSPMNSAVKVIYRGSNSNFLNNAPRRPGDLPRFGPNVPSIAPYTLQAAVPPPPPVFVPKEYDYQLQYLPYATPYVGSVYEYGLQAAVPPPPPVHIPLRNLKTGVERVVLDAPAQGLFCGTSICHSAPVNNPPLPLRLNSGDCECRQNSCGCDSDRFDSNIYGLDKFDPDEFRSGSSDSCGCNTCGCRSCGCSSCGSSSCGSSSCGSSSCGCDSCSRARIPLLKADEDKLEKLYRGPIIEPIVPSFCTGYAPIFTRNFLLNSLGVIRDNLSSKSNKFRRKRDLSGSTRNKRDIIDLPMNFMFKFVPNLLRGPIVNAMHTIQHNANSAVVRARANANKQRMQAHLARSKHKLKQQKGKYHSAQNMNQNPKRSSKSSDLFGHHPNLKVDKKYSVPKLPQKRTKYLNTDDKDEMISSYVPSEQLFKVGKYFKHNQDINVPRISSTPTHKLNHGHVVEEHEDVPFASNNWMKHPKLGSKYNIERNEDFVSKTNEFLHDIFNILDEKPKASREHKRSNDQSQKSLDEIRNHLHRKGYSNEDIRDIMLAKMKKFNELYERKKRSISLDQKESNTNKEELIDIDENHKIKRRKKRAVLLDTNQFQLPFFEIEDEILDNYYSENSGEEVVGRKQKKRKKKRRRHYDDSEMESGEEILGANHPMHDHPFVVLLRAPLKFLHHFHDIRKNFRPILYSFPKILQSSRKYLKDFAQNLQTGVLDFASNIMGDFNNQSPKRYDSIFFPTRQRRSITENVATTDEIKSVAHKRDKRYILKVVDEKEVQEFLEEKLGGYFDDDEEEEHNAEKDEESEERVGKAETIKKTDEKKFIVKKLSPKLILDNNGKPFIEINGNKRPLFFGKKKTKSTLLQKSKQKTLTSNSEENEPDDKEKEADTKHDEINDKIDEVIAQAKQKLKEGEILKAVHCDEMPTQTIKEKINEISSYIQNLVNLDCSKYADLYENLSKLEKMRKSVTEYWKKVMINEKTNDIQCKIKILKYIREMQNEKDKATKIIAEYLKEGDNFIVKRLIKLLVRLQKLQCLIQKIVDHFDNRMKVGTLSDTEKEIKFIDYLSSLSFDSIKNEEEFVCSLKKDKHESLHKEIKFLENLRLLLQKDDTYITNEVAKQIWEMKNTEKLLLGAIEEMNNKLEDNMKIRKELKILFDLLNQIEASENACEKLLLKVGDNNVVGSKFMLNNNKRQIKRPNLSEMMEKLRNNFKATLAARKLPRKT